MYSNAYYKYVQSYRCLKKWKSLQNREGNNYNNKQVDWK